MQMTLTSRRLTVGHAGSLQTINELTCDGACCCGLGSYSMTLISHMQEMQDRPVVLSTSFSADRCADAICRC